MFNTSNQQGLSLLEFIIALAIIIILTVVAIPSFIAITKSQRLQATAEDLYYALQLARNEAIKQNSTVYVTYTTGDTWCYGIKVGSTCDCTVAGNCTLLQVSAPKSQQLSLSSVGYNTNTITFEGTHGAANNSGSLTFTLYGQTSLITISIGVLGNLQMCSTGISGYTAC